MNVINDIKNIRINFVMEDERISFIFVEFSVVKDKIVDEKLIFNVLLLEFDNVSHVRFMIKHYLKI